MMADGIFCTGLIQRLGFLCRKEKERNGKEDQAKGRSFHKYHHLWERKINCKLKGINLYSAHTKTRV
jgi:hypothetical protein